MCGRLCWWFCVLIVSLWMCLLKLRTTMEDIGFRDVYLYVFVIAYALCSLQDVGLPCRLVYT